MKDQIAPFLRAGKPIPLTYADYAHRAALTTAQAKGAVDELCRSGMLHRTPGTRDIPSIYDLTPVGIAVARSMGAAE